MKKLIALVLTFALLSGNVNCAFAQNNAQPKTLAEYSGRFAKEDKPRIQTAGFSGWNLLWIIPGGLVAFRYLVMEYKYFSHFIFYKENSTVKKNLGLGDNFRLKSGKEMMPFEAMEAGVYKDISRQFQKTAKNIGKDINADLFAKMKLESMETMLSIQRANSNSLTYNEVEAEIGSFDRWLGDGIEKRLSARIDKDVFIINDNYLEAVIVSDKEPLKAYAKYLTDSEKEIAGLLKESNTEKAFQEFISLQNKWRQAAAEKLAGYDIPLKNKIMFKAGTREEFLRIFKKQALVIICILVAFNAFGNDLQRQVSKLAENPEIAFSMDATDPEHKKVFDAIDNNEELKELKEYLIENFDAAHELALMPEADRKAVFGLAQEKSKELNFDKRNIEKQKTEVFRKDINKHTGVSKYTK